MTSLQSRAQKRLKKNERERESKPPIVPVYKEKLAKKEKKEFENEEKKNLKMMKKKNLMSLINRFDN